MSGKVYCIKCVRLVDDGPMVVAFKTGFIRIGIIDYPLGVCFLHQCSPISANPSP
jgi:hypothetical protein